ncbi:protein bicaudal D homolog 1-like isoform X1 [Lates japonicus]
MAAGGAGCGDTVEQCRVEVERLTRELAEANREKIRAAECGLVVLEENQSLKQQYADLEAEQEALRLELEQLQEVGSAGVCFVTRKSEALLVMTQNVLTDTFDE